MVENKSDKENRNNEKTATDNQWVSTGLEKPTSKERRDGPGGENSNN